MSRVTPSPESRAAQLRLFDLEMAYLQDSAHTGSVPHMPPSFSPSACSCPPPLPLRRVAEEQATGRDADGRSDLHVLFSSRSKSSGAPGNGPTQRRGRGATPREGKRLRQQVEQVEPEEEEEDCVL
ncbi:unnamed protein product [Closterium sp. NIES-65]|nr:unnamed protein product [Closterium sp. NIES-65]